MQGFQIDILRTFKKTEQWGLEKRGFNKTVNQCYRKIC